MRNASTNVVYNLVKGDRNVLAITADNRNEIYEKIMVEYPEQYIDYGIAECNMIASAAGLASEGKIPFIYTVTNFLSMRGYEFIRNVVCANNYHVVFLGRSAGLVTGTYGMTHEGTEDLAILRTLPNMLVISPASPLEAKKATEYAYEHDGPIYIRLEGAGEPELFDDTYTFVPGKGIVMREGKDVTVICSGSVLNEVMKSAKRLNSENINAQVINMPVIKPVDSDLVVSAALKTKLVVTIEEGTVYGGLGSAVAEVLMENQSGAKMRRIGLRSFPCGCGNRDEMRAINGLDSASIYKEILSLVKEKGV